MDPQIEVRHLRHFIAVAEELHFGRAAVRLHLAQPALSQTILQLEGILGVSLFTRTSRSVVLTAAGEVLLDRARRTVRDLRLHAEEARSVGRGEAGFLNVGFIGSGMLTSLPAVLQRYRSTYPGVQMHLHESFTSRVVAGLVNGSLDAGLLRDGDPHGEVVTETLFTEPFLAILPADHPRARQKSVAATSLRGDAFVFYARSAGSLAYDKPLSLCGEAGFHPRVVQEASNWLTILQLISVGFGVSIAPACVSGIAPRNVVCLPLRGATAVSHVELAVRANDKRPIVQSFARIARSVARQKAGANRGRAASASVRS